MRGARGVGAVGGAVRSAVRGPGPVTALVVLCAIALAGCGGEEAPSGATASASSAGASPSASPSASPVDPAEARKRAASATKKALLPASVFDKVGLAVEDPPKERKWDWFSTCRPYLASESKQVTGYNGQWKGKGLLVSQTVVAYPDGVAEEIVGEVADTVTCTEYAASDSQFTQVKSVKLPAVEDAAAQHAWCSRQDDEFFVCHSVIAAQDLVSNLWVAAENRGDAEETLTALTQLAAARIAAQIEG